MDNLLHQFLSTVSGCYMYPAPNILVKNEDQSFQTWTICSTNSFLSTVSGCYMYPAPNILVKNEDQSFQTWTICSTNSSPRCLEPDSREKKSRTTLVFFAPSNFGVKKVFCFSYAQLKPEACIHYFKCLEAKRPLNVTAVTCALAASLPVPHTL